MSRRFPPLLLAVPLLGIARLLPEEGVGLWVRLAAATLVLLLPGRLVARALGRSGASGALAWSCALVAGALAITFAVHGSLDLTLALVLVAGAVALPFTWRDSARQRLDARALSGRTVIALVGAALGIALWSVEGLVHGDAIFHLGRVRKLDELGSLSLRAVDEFRNGGLHPGYAFPLWHGWLALVAKLADVDPTSVVLHESSILAPLALVIAFEAGRAVFRSTWLACSVVLAQVSLIALAPGGGGSYVGLELPGTTARQLLVPAVIALFFLFVREPSWQVAATLGAVGVDLAFVHPTYALFIAIPLAGFALARVLIAGVDARRSAGGLAAFGVPVVLAFAWLLPIVRETKSHDPAAGELARGLKQYRTDLVVHSASSYHLAPSVVARTGAIAVAALILVPVAAFAARRRWSAFVLGGAVAVLALELLPYLFPRFSDLVLPRSPGAQQGSSPSCLRLPAAPPCSRASRGVGSCRSRSPPASSCSTSFPATSGRSSSRGARRWPRGSRSGAASPAWSSRPCSCGRERRVSAAAGSSARGPWPRSRWPSSSCRWPCTASRTGTPSSRPIQVRSARASCSSCVPTSRSEPWSSPISRRATGSRPLRRCTSPTARRRTSPTRGPIIPTPVGPT